MSPLARERAHGGQIGLPEQPGLEDDERVGGARILGAFVSLSLFDMIRNPKPRW